MALELNGRPNTLLHGFLKVGVALCHSKDLEGYFSQKNLPTKAQDFTVSRLMARCL